MNWLKKILNVISNIKGQNLHFILLLLWPSSFMVLTILILLTGFMKITEECCLFLCPLTMASDYPKYGSGGFFKTTYDDK